MARSKSPPVQLSALGKASSRTDQALQAIRNAILAGDLEPGQPLVERDLAEVMGISKTPVREALKTLCASGLVENETYQSMAVRSLDLRELRDIAEVRKLMEPYAVASAMESGPHPHLNGIEDTMEESLDASASDDTVRLAECNRSFHRLLYSGSRNQYLVKQLDQLQDLLAFYGLAGWKYVPPTEVELDEHGAILDAVKGGDADQAAAAMREHIQESTKRLQGALEGSPSHAEGSV